MWTVWLLTCSQAWTQKKDKEQVPQRNEMLSLIVLHLVSLVNKIYLTVGIWKTWYYKKLLTRENNQLECGDYSLLFSMHTDDDEQHFN